MPFEVIKEIFRDMGYLEYLIYVVIPFILSHLENLILKIALWG